MRIKRLRSGAFTLVELLVVMAIVILLATFLIGALWPAKGKAMRGKTKALLDAIQAALTQYYTEFRDYPPDGYDMEPGWVGCNAKCSETSASGAPVGMELPAHSGRLYAGSGCLIYFLCYPITNFYTIGSDSGTFDQRNQRATTVGPFLTTLKNDDISVRAWDADFDLAIRPGNPSYKIGWEKGEILDAFGFPIHYDKVKDPSDPQFAVYFNAGRFSGTTGLGSHTDQTYYDQFVQARAAMPEDNVCPSGTHGGGTSGPHHSDPRGVPDSNDQCYLDNATAKPRNPNSFDLWAHGQSFSNGRTAISNWNVAQ